MTYYYVQGQSGGDYLVWQKHGEWWFLTTPGTLYEALRDGICEPDWIALMQAEGRVKPNSCPVSYERLVDSPWIAKT